jgi:hypothetical protein
MTAGANLYTLVYQGQSWALQGKVWDRAGQYNGCRGQVSVLRSCRESWPVQLMSRTGVDATSQENKSIECRVCRRRCLLFAELFETDNGIESNAARLA